MFIYFYKVQQEDLMLQELDKVKQKFVLNQNQESAMVWGIGGCDSYVSTFWEV